MSILILAEHDNIELKITTLNLVFAATKIDSDIHLLVAGAGCDLVAQAAAKIAHVKKVLFVDDEACRYQQAEVIAPLLHQLSHEYSHVLAAASTTGKNILPRAAAFKDSQPISDVIAIDAPDCFKRYIYAGNVISTVKSVDQIKFLTVRTIAFDAVNAEGGSAILEHLTPTITPPASRFVRRELVQSDSPDITTARVVVSGGRGLQNGENFRLLYELAERLSGAVGASRAAVDAGFVSNDMQVGQTGKIVAPELYIAVGISGAIQHLAGMKDSKIIVAINKDPDAPIFQAANYGLVADLFEALPQLTGQL